MISRAIGEPWREDNLPREATLKSVKNWYFSKEGHSLNLRKKNMVTILKD